MPHRFMLAIALALTGMVALAQEKPGPASVGAAATSESAIAVTWDQAASGIPTPVENLMAWPTSCTSLHARWDSTWQPYREIYSLWLSADYLGGWTAIPGEHERPVEMRTTDAEVTGLAPALFTLAVCSRNAVFGGGCQFAYASGIDVAGFCAGTSTTSTSIPVSTTSTSLPTTTTSSSSTTTSTAAICRPSGAACVTHAQCCAGLKCRGRVCR